jgi:hypothetical protein
MRRLKSLILGLALATGVSAAAQSQVTDMSKFTCKQLTDGTSASFEAAVWFNGYYSGLRKNTKIDPTQFKANADVVIKACRDNPNSTVMRIIQILQKRMN